MSRAFDKFARGIGIAFLLAAAPAQSIAAAKEAPSVETSANSLKPGQFVWQPERAKEGPVEIMISLGQQRAYVFRSGTLIGVSTISSGKPGHDSPVGLFPILQKKKDHRSNKYNNAPMPYMQRLNWYGVALHGGAIPGYPASHGCIRLPMKFAQHLFQATQIGSRVFIADEVPSSPKAALAMVRGARAPATASADAGTP
ncbi:MAG TPA: L,D-transpeptidase family protein [Allosphingosinicella sp.]|nr:L,D-transpeptidase family protein [Allosphingosinicella sp.]